MKRVALLAVVIAALFGWTQIAGAQTPPRLTRPALDQNVQVINGIGTLHWAAVAAIALIGGRPVEAEVTYEVQQRVVGAPAGWQTLPHGGYPVTIDSSGAPVTATVGSAEHPVGEGYRWRVRAKAAGWTDSDWSETGRGHDITPQRAAEGEATVSEWTGSGESAEVTFTMENYFINNGARYIFVGAEAETYDSSSSCFSAGTGDGRTRDRELTCPASFFTDNCLSGCTGRVWLDLRTSPSYSSPPSTTPARWWTYSITDGPPGFGPTPTPTPRPAPTDAPGSLAFVSESGTTVNLSWTRIGAEDDYDYDVSIWRQGGRHVLPDRGVTFTVDQSDTTVTAAVSDVPTGTQYFSVRGTAAGGDGPWSDLVSNLSATPAPTPTSSPYAGAPARAEGNIYTPDVPQVDRSIDGDNLTLTWGEIDQATHYDVRLNDRVLRLETTGLAEQQVVIDLSEHDDVILRYAVRAVVVAGATQIDITNDDEEVVFVIPPYIEAISQWSAEGFVQLSSGTLSSVSMAEAEILATPEVNTVAFQIVSDLGQVVGLIDQEPADSEVNAWMLPIALLGSVALSAVPILVIGRGRTDKAAVIAAGLVFVFCWGILGPTYLGVSVPVMVAVLLLVIILGGIALAAKIFL